MIALLFASTGIGVGAVCVVAACQRWRRLNGGREMARLPIPQVPSELTFLDSRTEPAVRAILEAPSRAHAVAELNDLMGEIQYALDAGRGIAPAAARLALLSGTLCAVLEFLVLPTSAGVLAGIVAIGAGTISGGACCCLGRLADREAEGRRQWWNRMASRVDRWLDARGGA